MSIWKNSKIALLWYSKDEASEQNPCEVRIDDQEIVVEYEDDGLVQYRGKNTGDGHFELTAPDVEGRASLHMFPGSNVLEGSWVEGRQRGMWRITLA
jgi:hypothetical protein